MGGGDNFCGRGTISASGLRPWGTISASRLCPGGQNLRGDRICSDNGTWGVKGPWIRLAGGKLPPNLHAEQPWGNSLVNIFTLIPRLHDDGTVRNGRLSMARYGTVIEYRVCGYVV